MSGSVLLKSADHNTTLQFNNVLLMESCSKKLLLVSVFDTKGCKITYGGGSVSMTNLIISTNKTLLSGKLMNGLYYWRASTILATDNASKDTTPNTTETFQLNGSTSSADQPQTFFGLKPGKIDATSQDFPRKLYEAHVSYVYLNFTKLRKLLGLSTGTAVTNPRCEACEMANSRQNNSKGIPYDRAKNVLGRTFMDLGFTGNKNDMLTFQLYVDDYDRVSHLDVLEGGKGDCLGDWIHLKNHEENMHRPEFA